MLVHVKIQDLEGGLIQEQQAQSLWIRQEQLTAVCRRAEPVATGPSVWMPGSIKTVLYRFVFCDINLYFCDCIPTWRALQYYKKDLSIFFYPHRHMTEHQTPGPTMRQTDALTTYQRHTQIARPHKIMHRIFILIVMRIRVTRFSVKRIKSVF